jgi:hypothetical protein|tara:strand:+ start:1700 stop:2053 length:354 start_codon:yes stop_codon:yes gene_type:complete
MTRAIELLKNSFGVSQLYKHDVIKNESIILSVYWHPLTIAEREAIQKKSTTEDPNEFALNLMIEKALDKDGNRIFQDGDKASLRREVEANILQEIQLAMIEAGQTKEVREAKAELKS